MTRAAWIYLGILQGFGGGSGWDLSGEAKAAATRIQNVAKPTVIDGGASFGHWSAALDAALGHRDADYYLVEPQETCQPALTTLPLRNKTVVQAALGAQEGRATLSASRPGFPAASLYERRDTRFDDMSLHREPVRVITVDGLMADHGIDRVDLMKLDIEGAEIEALHGARQSLAEGRIRNIAFEFGAPDLYSRHYLRDFWDLFTDLGFRLCRILPGGHLFPVVAYGEELEQFRGASNYLAMAPAGTGADPC